MDYDEWEDSLSVIDLRHLVYLELLERYASEFVDEPRRCSVRQCRRHRFCAGPMVRAPGGLPGPWQQCGPNAIRPVCRGRFARFTLENVLEMGPKLAALAGEGETRLLLGNVIRKSRDERRARTQPLGGLKPGDIAEIVGPALRAGLFKFIEQ